MIFIAVHGLDILPLNWGERAITDSMGVHTHAPGVAGVSKSTVSIATSSGKFTVSGWAGESRVSAGEDFSIRPRPEKQVDA